MKVKDIIKDASIWMPSRDDRDKQPKVTVVLPTFRRAKNGYFKRAVESVLKQSFRRLELIIVDDCSTDGTFDQIREFMENDARVACIRHLYNIGLPSISEYEAYLKGRGSYIAYIFDDNEWNEDALAETYDYMQAHSIKASFGITQILDPDTKRFIELGHPTSSDPSQIILGNNIGNGAVVLHKEVLENVGLYDPHLALTRLCDWDLWIRISKKYSFKPTGIYFTKEYGPILNDSLGNSFKMDPWVAREHMQHRQEEMLLPHNFDEYDIVSDTSSSRSQLYINAMQAYIEQYKAREWFNSEQMHMSKVKKNTNHKYVLMVTASYTASCLSFFRLKSNDITFAFCYLNDFVHFIQFADAIIFVRLYSQYMINKELYSKLLIPCYLYIDDNFIEISNSGDSDKFLCQESKLWNKANFESLNGIICSTTVLRDYFSQKKLHKNVIFLNMLLDENASLKQNNWDITPTTFAFLGGAARTNMFNTCVLKVLRKISYNHPIRLCCPKGVIKDIESYQNSDFEIIEIDRSLNLELILNQYLDYKPQILIHCGGNHRNNIYKTKNALLNALYLGAVLVCSDIEPYCEYETDEPVCYSITENTPEAWEQILLYLLANSAYANKLFENAYNYCLKKYVQKNVWKELNEEFSSFTVKNEYQKIKQTEVLIHYLATQRVVQPSGINMCIRPFVPEELSLSGKIKSSRRYGFLCTVANLQEVGLLFAKLGECEGTVKLQFDYKRKILDSIQIDMQLVRQNDYTNVVLKNPIIGYMGKKLSVAITFDYVSKQGELQVFEIRKRRTFLYKAFNKLGYPLQGRDAIFIDCRE